MGRKGGRPLASFLIILLMAEDWAENNWKSEGNTCCQRGKGRLGRTSLDGVPGSVLGICHMSDATAHMSSHQMRVPGWSRNSPVVQV